MCIATEGEGDLVDLGTIAVWNQPIISSATQRPTLKPRAERITEEERKLRDQQLEALSQVHTGYTGEDDESYDRYMEENRQFHYLIAQASGMSRVGLNSISF